MTRIIRPCVTDRCCTHTEPHGKAAFGRPHRTGHRPSHKPRRGAWLTRCRDGRYQRRTELMWVMQIIGPIGFYAFASIAPIVLLAKGFDLAHSLTYSVLTALGYPLGSLLSVYLTERFERPPTAAQQLDAI